MPQEKDETADPEELGAQQGPVSGSCEELFGFAGEPVPVAKTADGARVLASVKRGYSASANLCYLVLDSADA